MVNERAMRVRDRGKEAMVFDAQLVNGEGLLESKQVGTESQMSSGGE